MAIYAIQGLSVMSYFSMFGGFEADAQFRFYGGVISDVAPGFKPWLF